MLSYTDTTGHTFNHCEILWLFQILIKANTYNSIITNIVIIIDNIILSVLAFIIIMKVEHL